METFSALLAIRAGNSPVTGEFPAKRPVTRSFKVFFDLRLNEYLSEAGDLRRYRAHYDVIVMWFFSFLWHPLKVASKNMWTAKIKVIFEISITENC